MAEVVWRTLTLGNATKRFSGVKNNVDSPQILCWWEVPANTRWQLVNGESIVAEIVDTNGDEISPSSLLIFGGMDVNQKVPTELVQHEYEPHSVLTLAQQNSDEYKEKTRMHIPGGGRTFGPRKRIALMVETPHPVEIDVLGSVVSFRVRELGMEEA